jgi:hypothetical protein
MVGTVAGGIVRGFGAVTSFVERKLRDEYEPLRGRVEQHDGWMEVTAIWDEDRLIDGDGANIVAELQTTNRVTGTHNSSRPRTTCSCRTSSLAGRLGQRQSFAQLA